jgi:hypothetical protein
MAHAAGERLARALHDGVEDLPTAFSSASGAISSSDDAAAAPPGMCVECRDQPHTLACPGCSGDVFCGVCFASVHRGGSRRSHQPTESLSPLLAVLEAAKAAALVSVDAPGAGLAGKRPPADAPSRSGAAGSHHGDSEADDVMDDSDASAAAGSVVAEHVVHDWVAMARVTPLRLTFEERRLLRLVEAALHVSEYTDKVDIAGLGWTKTKRIHEQLKALFSVLCGEFFFERLFDWRAKSSVAPTLRRSSGLLVAEDFEAGKAALADSDLSTHATLYRGAFELARRCA